MDETPGNSNQVEEYEKEIQELRWQIQKLQEAGNLKDYTGKNHYNLLPSSGLETKISERSPFGRVTFELHSPR